MVFRERDRGGDETLGLGRHEVCEAYVLRWLVEWRPQKRSPVNVTVGTPCHSASHVVSPPEYEMVSRIRSSEAY